MFFQDEIFDRFQIESDHCLIISLSQFTLLGQGAFTVPTKVDRDHGEVTLLLKFGR